LILGETDFDSTFLLVMEKTFFLFLIIGVIGCTPKLEQWFWTTEDIEQLPASYEGVSSSSRRSPCRQADSYIPDTNYLEFTPMKYIRVNFHWMNSRDSASNYTGQEAIDFTHGLLMAANYDLEHNKKMWLPTGNDTPVLPTRFRYILTPDPDDANDDGIYFHFDDELYYYVAKGKNRNLYDKTIYKKYAVQQESVLNIYMMPHHPDSLDSPTYNAYITGVALSDGVKMTTGFESKKSFWDLRGCFNHETGHIFGLSHTWAYNDGCDDTPKHKQECWNRGDRPGCDTLCSNNIMDYNAMQHAWTPCQIGKVHMKMASEKTKVRRYLQPNWCQVHEDRHIFIRDSINWTGNKDLEGHLTIESGGVLIIGCRISLPEGGEIVIKPGGKLILENARLHNVCGKEWAGIVIQQQGDKKGSLVFRGEPVIENTANIPTGNSNSSINE